MGGVSVRVRRFLLNSIGHRVTAIYSNCKITNGKGHIKMGEGSYCNSDCFFDMNDDVIIGRNTCIGMRCTFVTTTHQIGPHNKRAGETVTGPIHIGEGCWIGANVTIMPNVTIGNGVVIGAGSLVSKDLDDNALYYGVPVKLVRYLQKK